MSRIPPELEAEMTPAVKAAFLVLLDRIDELEAQLQKLTLAEECHDESSAAGGCPMP